MSQNELKEEKPLSQKIKKYHGSKSLDGKKILSIDNLTKILMISIGHWDNISGPNVDRIWIASQNKIIKSPSNAKIIDDYNPKDSVATLPLEPKVNKEHEKNEETSSTQETERNPDFNDFSSCTPLEIAEHISRYTLEAEISESMLEQKPISSKKYDPLNILSSDSRERAFSRSNNYNSNSPGSAKLLSTSPTTPNSGKLVRDVSTPDSQKLNNNVQSNKRWIDNVDDVVQKLNIDYKLHSFEKANYYTMSGSFISCINDQEAKSVINIVFPKDTFELISLHHDTIIDRMNQLIVLYIYLHKKHLSKLHEHVKRISKNINELFTVEGLPPFQLENSLLSSHIYDEIPYELNESNSSDPKLSNERQMIENDEFLSCILTSHFQTNRRTIFMGENIKLINLYISTLSMFITQEERKKSVFANQNSEYIPDLILQGVLGKSIDDNAVIQSIYPSTLVDLNRGLVFQTHPYHEYKALRSEQQKFIIQNARKCSYKNNLWVSGAPLFQPVKISASCIRCMVKECKTLHEDLKVGFIHHSLKGLEYRSFVLIKYVEALVEERNKEQQNSNNSNSDYLGNNNLNTGNFSPPSNTPLIETFSTSIAKRIKLDLDLEDQSYSVLLGIAELIKPGIHRTLFGDDPSGQQLKWVCLYILIIF